MLFPRKYEGRDFSANYVIVNVPNIIVFRGSTWHWLLITFPIEHCADTLQYQSRHTTPPVDDDAVHSVSDLLCFSKDCLLSMLTTYLPKTLHVLHDVYSWVWKKIRPFCDRSSFSAFVSSEPVKKIKIIQRPGCNLHVPYFAWRKQNFVSVI